MKIENISAAYESKKRLDLIKQLGDTIGSGKCGDLCLSVATGDKIRLGVELDREEFLGFLDQLRLAETDLLLELGVDP